MANGRATEESWSDFTRKISNNGNKKKTTEKISSTSSSPYCFRQPHGNQRRKEEKDFVTRNDEEGEIDLNFRDSNKSVISHIDTSNLKLFPASVDLAGERKRKFHRRRRRAADK